MYHDGTGGDPGKKKWGRKLVLWNLRVHSEARFLFNQISGQYFVRKNQRDFFSGALWEASKMFPESLVPSKVFVNRFFVAEAHPEIPHRRLDGATRCTNTSSSSDNKHLKHIHHIHPWKFTWNLKVIKLKRNIIFQTFIFLGSMLIFQGVSCWILSSALILGGAPFPSNSHHQDFWHF